MSTALPLPLREGVGGRGPINPALWLMAAYGFVAGLPLPLSGFTFRLWLSEGGVSLALIGLTANIGLAYSLKFLWAPVLDNAAPPGPLRRLGRRRGWLAAIQPSLAAAAALLALSDPGAPAVPLPWRWPPSSPSSPPARTSWSTPGASRSFPSIARARRWRPTSGAIASRC